MKHPILQGFFLLCLGQSLAKAEQAPDVSLRFHAQWNVGDKARQKLVKKYGLSRVSFDRKGHAIPHGLSKETLQRWKRLYEQCMRDGCYYCDAEEGSCETGTCGPKNALCKPYMETEGQPKCGHECADYAFNSTLI